MDKMKSTDVSAKIFSKTDRRADATFELGQGKRLEFHLRYNGKTAWANAFAFEGATMGKGLMLRFPISETAQPLHTLAQETHYLAERAVEARRLMNFVRIAMSKTRIPTFFRGQVEAELKLIEACVHHGLEVMELHRALEDFKSFGQTAEMDDVALSEEFSKAKNGFELWSGTAGQRDNRDDNLVCFELEQTVSTARRMLTLHRELVRRQNMSAHERLALKMEQRQMAQS